MTVPLYNLTDTWTDGGTVYNAILINVTNTASANFSSFFNGQVGGTSFVLLGRDSTPNGAIWLDTGAAAPTDQNYVLKSAATGYVSINAPLNRAVQVTVNNSPIAVAWNDGSQNSFGVASSYALGFADSGNPAGGSLDVALRRDAADSLAQRRGTTAQNFRVYNTFTSSTSYERFAIDWSTVANLAILDVQVGAGGGTQRNVSIRHIDSTTAGTASATFAATNCPATDTTTPYTWVKVTSSDGSTVYMPAWK